MLLNSKLLSSIGFMLFSLSGATAHAREMGTQPRHYMNFAVCEAEASDGPSVAIAFDTSASIENDGVISGLINYSHESGERGSYLLGDLSLKRESAGTESSISYERTGSGTMGQLQSVKVDRKSSRGLVRFFGQRNRPLYEFELRCKFSLSLER